MIGSDGLAYVDLRDDRNACEVELSVVAPCFNEADGLPEFYRRTAAACAGLHLESYEIVLVNDGSRDATWSVMNELAKLYKEVVAVNLSRNYGHQLALTA